MTLFSDVMVLNDIIEQAAGRRNRTPEQGGNVTGPFPFYSPLLQFLSPLSQMCISCVMSILLFDVHRSSNYSYLYFIPFSLSSSIDY